LSRTSSASSNGSQGLDVTDVVFPADGKEFARLAPIHVIWFWRKLAAVDSIYGIDQTILSIAQDTIPISGREQWSHPPRPLERQVRRVPHGPVSAAMTLKPLLCAEGIDGQLQGAIAVGRPPQLVVDDSKRAVGQEIDPIGLPPKRDSARTRTRLECEIPPE